MLNSIGIRREDKNAWERRVPLDPSQVERLTKQSGIPVTVQPSSIRSFNDALYRKAGSMVAEDLCHSSIVLGVKEMPISLFRDNGVYFFFAHVIKGQSYNMPMLRSLLEHRCTLIDYERITDDLNRRLISFSRFAGIAGMIETISAYSERLGLAGAKNPFGKIRQAFRYRNIEEAKMEISALARTIGLSGFERPVVCAILGYGSVARGAQEILDLLPCEQIEPAKLLELSVERLAKDRIFKVVFGEKDLVEPNDKNRQFELKDYYDHPEGYHSVLERYLPFLSIVLNCIYWQPRYPKNITRPAIRNLYSSPTSRPLLELIGDISCDIAGSIEITVKATTPDNPCYTYYPETDSFRDGIALDGPSVMAIDNLPCEFPGEASHEFGKQLLPLLEQIARTDFQSENLLVNLPDPIRKAVIVHRGVFTEPYRYLEPFCSKGLRCL